jgi:hypothetical protein
LSESLNDNESIHPINEDVNTNSMHRLVRSIILKNLCYKLLISPYYLNIHHIRHILSIIGSYQRYFNISDLDY